MSAADTTEATAPAPARASNGTPIPEDKAAQVARLLAEGKKALALKQWEEAVEKHASALQIQDEAGVDQLDVSKAPLLFNYGRALFELALSQQGVMGKEEVAKGTGTVDEDKEKAGKFVFEGDGDEDGEEEEGEGEGEEQDGADGEGGDEEEDLPEDDFNAAWEVLDVARTIYEREIARKGADNARDDRMSLAECYLFLGDISCETEKFDQAVLDYRAALEIKTALLPPSSRALASAHYQLSTALELTSAGRPAALEHVQAALDGFKARAEEVRRAIAGETTTEDLARMTEREREAELKDVSELIGDLEVKIDELKAAPVREDLVSGTINHLLGGIGGEVKQDAGPVNDLTSMVRKKKRPAPEAPAAAEDKSEKKPRV
ncbi:hypothetical protein CC85DRAFT_278350 [Cutaneotrichosporon oleaginosum]|uniref:Tetratricopeptide SHNi-TPR domain-containing protein n=1 Tax=Cutaneotrichosporon oleaginosum TaxID=879819 RepID=A0A0J0XG65_9TREE|nr:uncharacterized protein CC85DRAFT_278350 [Cutaneotrichosporon oleaginosum]KLT40065.1 hypothetical protein CC85DRAFT_278350 [Cutaneotrichosporon oleaginosum]